MLGDRELVDRHCLSDGIDELRALHVDSARARFVAVRRVGRVVHRGEDQVEVLVRLAVDDEIVPPLEEEVVGVVLFAPIARVLWSGIRVRRLSRQQRPHLIILQARAATQRRSAKSAVQPFRVGMQQFSHHQNLHSRGEQDDTDGDAHNFPNARHSPAKDRNIEFKMQLKH